MGNVLGAHTVHLRKAAALLAAVVVAGCGTTPAPRATGVELREAPAPVLPDTTGWGVHVLALERAPDGAYWVGTYGDGIHVLRPRSREWQTIGAGAGEGQVSWGFVNSIAFGPGRDEVWYGTVGNGFGRSTDGGRTWRNWTFDELGPQWQYVVPRGIIVRRDTVYIATADGLRVTGDGGATWRCVQARDGVAGGTAREDGCTERIASLPSKYLLSVEAADRGAIWVGHLRGLSMSTDGGRTWTDYEGAGITGQRVRAILLHRDSVLWVATETGIFDDSARAGQLVRRDIRVPGFGGLPGGPRGFARSPGALPPLIATSQGMVARIDLDTWRVFYLGAGDRYRPSADIWAAVWWGPPFFPLGGSAAGLNRILAGEAPVQPALAPGEIAQPAAGRHLWFGRPIADADGNPYVDATYRYGSTMGGNFQQHQGVEFNNPAGTPVRAIGDGVVVFAGTAEAGSNTVAIRHDRQWEGQHVFSTYYHNTALDVRTGQRVRAGDVIARVGNTGRATNDHLHLEVHVAPTADSAQVVHADVRFPPHTVNPQLWMQPLPGTGVVAGVVYDAAGERVQGARIYGLVLPYPAETPFSFAETYRDRARGTPAYGEHFAVGDVPAGDYTLGVQVDGQRVWRRVRVAEGSVTWVEFRP